MSLSSRKPRRSTPNLTGFAWLSVITAVITITLKGVAYWLTGSVGLLSDALESGVNLAAAIIALVALTVAALPPDDAHSYGHHKAEYFSSGVEGTLIILAAITIVISATRRFLAPEPLQQLDIGLAISIVAGLANFTVARVLLRAGQREGSVALEASARHLLTDVYTTAGVLVALIAIAFTGWLIIDPIVALLIALNITVAGGRLVRDATHGLMDAALPDNEIAQITAILQERLPEGASYHALRTRRSGTQRFVTVHIQTPGKWSVLRGHTLLEEIERDIRQELYPVTILTHLEPIEDPVSWRDLDLNRFD